MKPFLKRIPEGELFTDAVIGYQWAKTPRGWVKIISLNIGKLLVVSDIWWMDKKPLLNLRHNRLKN